jgi:hypothetical protein
MGPPIGQLPPLSEAMLAPLMTSVTMSAYFFFGGDVLTHMLYLLNRAGGIQRTLRYLR